MDETASKDTALPPIIDQIIPTLTGVIGESRKPTYRFLKLFDVDVHQFDVKLIDEHSNEDDINDIVSAIEEKGGNWAIVSDCGMPVLADPGAKLIAIARDKGWQVEVFPGPSSIMQTLVLSGFSGQHFMFHGYFPHKEETFKDIIQHITHPIFKGYTHLWIEAPYRNEQRLKTLLELLPSDTMLCIALEISSKNEAVYCYSVSKWKTLEKESFHKRAAVFALKIKSAQPQQSHKNQRPYRLKRPYHQKKK